MKIKNALKSFLHVSSSLACGRFIDTPLRSVNCNQVFSTIGSKTSRQHPTKRFQRPFNDFLSCAIIFICKIFSLAFNQKPSKRIYLSTLGLVRVFLLLSRLFQLSFALNVWPFSFCSHDFLSASLNECKSSTDCDRRWSGEIKIIIPFRSLGYFSIFLWANRA